ncbi:MAG: tRNA guanosine(34) transglycosylase Tgt [Rhodothermaceae bacterium]|nr:tRNA guanosine(34) transglycosylase Tgt [Rhodothermaceae bacterium]
MLFEVSHESEGARAGRLVTERGEIQTPVFMPVGTAGTVKGLSPRELKRDLGAQIILGNTYHLYLRPGAECLKQADGLHKFMAWNRPILTDSGGYQVYSLASRCKITDEGAMFQSHIDGSRHLFTPESVIDFQRILGSDIMMVLDECPPAGVSRSRAKEANQRTAEWAQRSMVQFEATRSMYGHPQLLFAIVQGSTFPDLRRESVEELAAMDFPGYASGGLSVGEEAEILYKMVSITCEMLPPDKPRYLMGVGTPANLLEAIGRGVDMFDCVMPTRNGRNGMLFTTHGMINIRNRRWASDYTALDSGLDTYASQTFTRAYVRHLFQCNEILGLQISAMQNLALYAWLMRGARLAIQEGRYAHFASTMKEQLSRRL